MLDDKPLHADFPSLYSIGIISRVLGIIIYHIRMCDEKISDAKTLTLSLVFKLERKQIKYLFWPKRRPLKWMLIDGASTFCQPAISSTGHE